MVLCCRHRHHRCRRRQSILHHAYTNPPHHAPSTSKSSFINPPHHHHHISATSLSIIYLMIIIRCTHPIHDHQSATSWLPSHAPSISSSPLSHHPPSTISPSSIFHHAPQHQTVRHHQSSTINHITNLAPCTTTSYLPSSWSLKGNLTRVKLRV